METSKKILNRFNFCEQGIQTYTPPKKVQFSSFLACRFFQSFIGLGYNNTNRRNFIEKIRWSRQSTNYLS